MDYDGFMGDIRQSYRLQFSTLFGESIIVLVFVVFFSAYFYSFPWNGNDVLHWLQWIFVFLPVIVYIARLYVLWSRRTVVLTDSGILLPNLNWPASVPILFDDLEPGGIKRSGFGTIKGLILTSVKVHGMEGYLPLGVSNGEELYRTVDYHCSRNNRPIPTAVRSVLGLYVKISVLLRFTCFSPEPEEIHARLPETARDNLHIPL